MRNIDDSGIPAYLTSIISSSLKWLNDEEAKVKVWESASARLSERSGRSAVPQMSRRFRFPAWSGGDDLEEGGKADVEVVLKEPSLTADNLGHKTWLASYLLAGRLPKIWGQHGRLGSRAADEDGKVTKLLELGSGTGLLGIAAAAAYPDVEVTLTDLPEIVRNLEDNVVANSELFRTQNVPTVEILDWSLTSDREKGDNDYSRKYDMVIAADPLYSPEHPRWLVNAIIANLKYREGARVIIELPLRDSYTPEIEDFRQRMLDVGFQLTTQGREKGFEDWESAKGERVEVECWWGVWKWGANHS